VAGNHLSFIAGELYSLRRKCVHKIDNLYVYGRGWNRGLKTKKQITVDIPDHLFNETIFTIKKEAMYLHSLLPQIIAERNVGLREDFLENSGLDRFYVEELEREYYEKNGLDIEDLYQIRKGLS
jgi:uncharacterized protein (TIGR04442 family)